MISSGMAAGAGARGAHRGVNQCQAGPMKKFWPMADRRNEKGFFIVSQIFSKFQTNLNFNNFYSHNKMQEHFTP
jgi:hypothetical protein